MKIAIISDSHDNIPNIEKFLDWANDNKIEMIIHCGDIAAPSVIKEELAPKFNGPIHLVYGNVTDRDLLPEVCAELENVTLHGDVGELDFSPPSQGGDAQRAEGVKIAFCHFSDQAKKLAESGKYNLVFYGHTHKPWEEVINGCRVINPGTLAGMFYKATFAVYDTKDDKLELKLVELI
ncbi:metallophosphoesterase family protein [Candidatus Falkowbacteria bacterium]|nr:metallophosphoesterase family protein [Candidatus Falkowbacteria bacterium]